MLHINVVLSRISTVPISVNIAWYAIVCPYHRSNQCHRILIIVIKDWFVVVMRLDKWLSIVVRVLVARKFYCC